MFCRNHAPGRRSEPSHSSPPLFDGRDADLAAGLWVVRLRAPFDRKLFPSASSEALRAAARTELSQLMARVMARSQPAA